ncbi:uncharacterized protein LAESUDRAFT_12495 [Laetiporus sulphureus 93-53]|uniref:Uncharacterized protein n=1 Tax=Laetiporus sulphureus 93-53 TaxID=1314785 RepID=A0A165I822_9APHY|nr:uncharacterized protein LAESUDRAFT_12495 [Laetiporus sulphureus 93-53]KZT12711.1 hypothetical protein LAESUDRAFT_12495 [Laetiporus sulphureus 93-53]
MVNNAHLIQSLLRQLQQSESDPSSSMVVRERVQSEPCLLARLPSTAFIQREAEQLAPKAIIKQLRHTPPSSPELDAASPLPEESIEGEVEEEQPVPQTPQEEETIPSPSRAKSLSSVLSSISLPSPNFSLRRSSRSVASTGTRPWKEPEPYEVFRAVEKKDIMFLMEVRDKAFHLLLRKNGDASPLLHCIRIGKSHQEVAIVLLGAFSRYINNLQDDEINLPRTKMLLKALRVNLRLAIDLGLQTSQSDLIASFLQTLIMSEGDKWVWAQTGNVASALRAGTAGKPVKTAEDAVRGFATKELGKAKLIAAFEDYVGNATTDLLMMGAWSLVMDHVQAELIPSWYFARDDRVYKAFVERLDRHKADISRVIGRRLRWQLRVLRQVLEGRSTSYHSKVQMLAEEFDEGEGV